MEETRACTHLKRNKLEKVEGDEKGAKETGHQKGLVKEVRN